jgi:hypothetical protein
MRSWLSELLRRARGRFHRRLVFAAARWCLYWGERGHWPLVLAPCWERKQPLLVHEQSVLWHEHSLLEHEQPSLEHEQSVLWHEQSLLDHEHSLLVHEQSLLWHEQSLLEQEQPSLRVEPLDPCAVVPPRRRPHRI